MPITPKDCLIVLPSPIAEPRIVPFYVNASESMTRDIAQVLFCAAKEEFLSASNASLSFNNENPSNRLSRVIKGLIEQVSES